VVGETTEITPHFSEGFSRRPGCSRIAAQHWADFVGSQEAKIAHRKGYRSPLKAGKTAPVDFGIPR
jgi:hypothetical protein